MREKCCFCGRDLIYGDCVAGRFAQTHTVKRVTRDEGYLYDLTPTGRWANCQCGCRYFVREEKSWPNADVESARKRVLFLFGRMKTSRAGR